MLALVSRISFSCKCFSTHGKLLDLNSWFRFKFFVLKRNRFSSDKMAASITYFPYAETPA